MSDDSRPPPPSADDNGTSSAQAAASSNGDSVQARLRKRFATQTKRKAEFIHDIMFNLDIMIYAEICVLYYMDCSFFRFLVRVLFQLMFLTPKPKFVPPTPKHRPYIGAILGGNITCILLHLFTRRPEAGELTGGYLHGGIIIDFIGQKGPIPKLQLVGMDLLITALQCFMLAVHVEETRLKEVLNAPESPFTLPATTPTPVTAQDHDAEERGITRDVGMSSEDVELQELRRSGTENESLGMLNRGEQDQLLSEATDRSADDTSDGPLDLYYSGNVIVGDFHILHTLRSQWEDYDSATTSALQNVGFSATYHFSRVNHQLRRLERLQQ